MADEKLSALVELAATPAVDDELYIRDVSELAADESKRITIANLIDSRLGSLGASAYVMANDAGALAKAFGVILEAVGYPVGIADNTADEVQVNAELTANFKVVLSDGTLTVAASITKTITYPTLHGVGLGTNVTQANDMDCNIITPGGTGWDIGHMHIDGNGGFQTVGGNGYNANNPIYVAQNFTNVHHVELEGGFRNNLVVEGAVEGCVVHQIHSHDTVEFCGIALFNGVSESLISHIYGHDHFLGSVVVRRGCHDIVACNILSVDDGYGIYGADGDESGIPSYRCNWANVTVVGNTGATAFKFRGSYDCLLTGYISQGSFNSGFQFSGGLNSSFVGFTIAEPNDTGLLVTTNDYTGQENSTNLFLGNGTIRKWGQAGATNAIFVYCSVADHAISDIMVSNVQLLADSGAGANRVMQIGDAGHTGSVNRVRFVNIACSDHLGNFLFVEEVGADDCALIASYSGGADGFEADDGDDWMIIANRFKNSGIPIDVNNANVVRPMILANNWSLAGNNPWVTTCTDKLIHANVDKDGHWYVVDDYFVMRKVWIADDVLNPSIDSVPANSYIRVSVQVTQAFDDGATLTIGDDADPDGIITALDITSTGNKTVAYGTQAPYLAATTAVEAYVTGTPTVGKAIIIFEVTTCPAEVA